jgi:hypothetical protein
MVELLDSFLAVECFTMIIGRKKPKIVAPTHTSGLMTKYENNPSSAIDATLSTSIWRGSMKRNMSDKSFIDLTMYRSWYCSKAFERTPITTRQRKKTDPVTSSATSPFSMVDYSAGAAVRLSVAADPLMT